MTNLELIEKEIEIAKKQLAKYPLDKEQSNPNYRYKEADLQYIHNNFYTQRLNQLQQIKTIFLAWESIKQGLKIREGKFDDDSYYEYLDFEYDLFDEGLTENAGERLIPIKKALEV